MSGEDRRKKIIDILSCASDATSGGELSKRLGVSRQVIVQDISLLRAANYQITATTRGYIMPRIPAENRFERIFKVNHSEDEITEEMNLIVDYGGWIIDEFVYHKVYGVISAKLNIKSRNDVLKYVENINTGKSRPLMDVTSGYHYHTVSADREQILDEIQSALEKKGFLARLLDYEPVNFWDDLSKK